MMDERQAEALAIVNAIKSVRNDVGWILYRANKADETMCSIRKRVKNLLGDDELMEREQFEPIKMEEDFVFGYRINEETKREAVLSKEEKSLLMQGLHYALTKDFASKRKGEYRDLLKKLNVVINGGKSVRGRI